jgi:hypothetical protein
VSEETSAGNVFFSVIAKPQSYLSIVYLLLAFPLGIFYFVFLVTGLSLGLGLVVILVGIPILAGVLAASYGMAAFEREMAINMLKVDIPPMQREKAPPGFWAKFKALVTNPVTWKGVLYLFIKFPLGIASFVLVVTLLSTSLGLLAAPFIYSQPWGYIDLGFCEVDTALEAGLTALGGIFLFFASLHVLNWAARMSGWFARVMLGRAQAGTPVTGPAADRPDAQEAIAQTG